MVAGRCVGTCHDYAVIGWLVLQVDLQEFTARLHEIAITKPAWLPKIRAVAANASSNVFAEGPNAFDDSECLVALQVMSSPCTLPYPECL